ncbi:hypothetical protein BN3661_01520 [Eubacteriaceae bacterium CHKCI005]|uniref:Uncharacterized protein n=1 Tax=Solibaculum mannosilyticum TaxID=2780922 RepID=A0A7I8D1F7_9FIRM|nr:hypothetical protein [Solibaculum mannosilyticum]BCI60637.1 hypothetical protein C12CBH8_12760 [Solibaculum mannosilyticum]CZT56704.1 hypothetical protein BN3661_01520 [Eubacteriaceae bacterium CHKCI005]
MKNDEKSKYTKEQLVNADKYRHSKDLLNALLDADKLYSHDDVEQLTKRFLKGKVKAC